MAIYTKKGDKGKTNLFSGKKIWKSDLRMEIYGTLDELNSLIGVVLSSQNQISDIKKELIEIQNDLLNIGSDLTDPRSKPLNGLEKRVKEFENLIDKMTAQMPKLKNFILPGGGKTGAMLHLARSVCRRLERRVVELSNKRKINNEIIVYLNRLSDLLFTMGRFANFREKRREIVWLSRK